MTVQGVLEAAISEVTQEPVPVTGAGRTDAGAHAVGQVIAFQTSSVLSAETLERAINAHLPMDVAVVSAEEVDEDFHPRFDASSRVYRYLICNGPTRSPLYEGRATHVSRPLDLTAMQAAGDLLLGCHDFSAFSSTSVEGSRQREMFAVDIHRDGNVVSIDLEASGFLQQMARSIAGTLIRVGEGKMTPQEFAAVLASGDRHQAADTAPACGLYLIRVKYDSDMTVDTAGDSLGGARAQEEK